MKAYSLTVNIYTNGKGDCALAVCEGPLRNMVQGKMELTQGQVQFYSSICAITEGALFAMPPKVKASRKARGK